MFLRRISVRPLAGKGPALRTLLVSGERPGRWNVTERLTGPSPEYRLQFFYDSLSEMQAAIEAAQTQQPPPELATLAAAAPALELEEIVSPAQAGAAMNYASRIVYEYAPGRLSEVRSLLEEVTQRRIAAGARITLAMRVSGGAPALIVVTFYQSLGDLETTRAKAMADPAQAERGQRLAGLLARPYELPEITRIVARST